MPEFTRPPLTMDRRAFLHASGVGLGMAGALDQLVPAFARRPFGLPLGTGRPGSAVDLTVGKTSIPFGGKVGNAITVNGSVPGPLLRFREGETAILRVTNTLSEDTSIHWHGILLPPEMDGVPMLSFPGIPPGETFEYHFPIKQHGTYWYHSHSGLQEQSGVYGPLVIDPSGPEEVQHDREHVILLSDWTFEDPHRVQAKLKKMGGYYNRQRNTLRDLLRGSPKGSTLRERLQWGRMRMDPTDIADVTGMTYTYLMNGMSPASNWTGHFRSGERVRLRLINGSAATFFDVRIPGVPMTVIAADGQSVDPVEVDELRIAIAETYDVIVDLGAADAYSIFAETMDRSGFAIGTLAQRDGLRGEVPERRTRPVRGMADMGMDMGAMGMAGMAGMEGHEGHEMPSSGTPHGPDGHGSGNSMVPEMTLPRLDDPGVGLGEDGRRVLRYSDLRSVAPWYDTREPTREVELHLTGNMERYMWSFDGKKYSESPDPIRFQEGERIRLILVNDTMMEHPIHLHGMWMQLENGNGAHSPLKHTVNVKPAERVSLLITADAVGQWAFHCHILYHMEVGMFRVVEVVAAPSSEAK